MLHGKRLVVAGVSGDHSVAYPIADLALRAGAFVTLAATPEHFVRCRQRVGWLPRGAHAVRSDPHAEQGLAVLREHLRCAYGTVDGAVLVPDAAAPAFPAFAAAMSPLLGDAGVVVGVAPSGDAEAPAAELAPGRLVRVAGPPDAHELAQTVCEVLAGHRARPATGLPA